MRLKSLRLRRREEELMEQHREDSQRKTIEAKRAVVDAVQPSGRVRHDERGMAVWDLAIATGELHTLSATSALKKLHVGDLKIEDTTRVDALSPDKVSRDKGGGFDPYDRRPNARAPGAASQPAGVTGAKASDRQTVMDQLLGKKK